jgi:hypothetical protein
MTCRWQRQPWAVWYGLQPSLTIPFAASARRRFGSSLSAEVTDRTLVYRLSSLTVPGREDDVDVEMRFYRDGLINTFGLAAQDYPRVFASGSTDSPHRMPDKGLCLYFVRDHASARWVWSDGLESLIELVRDHLVLEDLWRTGRARGTPRWLAPEVPHGYAA